VTERAGRGRKIVGLLCNCAPDGDAKQELSPSIVNRAILIHRQLEPAGIEVFLYSPRDVTLAAEVPGFVIEADDLVAASRPVPSVNANWTYGTRRLLRKGMGYRGFEKWAAENGIAIYVPYAFSEVVSNKRKAFDVVSKFDPALHPHTEDFAGSSAQLSAFLERADLVFIKPRSGNKGNRIFVLRKEGAALSLKYYEAGADRVFSPVTTETALDVITVAAGDKSYIIQEGVDSLRFEGSVFDVRVVMVHDASRWHSILETRVAPANSDLSNIFQGGSIQVTEDIFESMLGAEKARELESEIRHVSHGLAEHLESLHPGDLMELGFDFVLDQECGLHLVEVNAKPGIAGFGSEAKIFEWKPEDEPYYQKWVYPHVQHLASFLQSKVEAKG
jgi:hypothetical protein